jgi:hypothetical protein
MIHYVGSSVYQYYSVKATKTNVKEILTQMKDMKFIEPKPSQNLNDY